MGPILSCGQDQLGVFHLPLRGQLVTELASPFNDHTHSLPIRLGKAAAMGIHRQLAPQPDTLATLHKRPTLTFIHKTEVFQLD